MKANLKAITKTALGVSGALALLVMSHAAATAGGASTTHDQHGANAVPDLTTVGNVPWDAEATAELTQALHDLHKTWNTGDITSLRKHMIGDDVLTTFELDPRTHRPIALSSKAEIDAFIGDIDTTQSQDNLVTKLEHPKLRCRATATWGVCTEQCKVHFSDAKTGEHVATDELISTQVAVKTEEGWRWIQWHMSQAGPAESVKERAIQ